MQTSKILARSIQRAFLKPLSADYVTKVFRKETCHETLNKHFYTQMKYEVLTCNYGNRHACFELKSHRTFYNSVSLSLNFRTKGASSISEDPG